MEKKQGDNWVPIWIDKWLFGSTRFELKPAERAIFLDLVVLGAKDDGHVRANKDTPYPLRTLAGMFNCTKTLLKSTIEKSIKYGKLEMDEKGFIDVVSFPKYELSKRHKRRLQTDTVSEKSDTKRESLEERREEKKEPSRPKTDAPSFENFSPEIQKLTNDLLNSVKQHAGEDYHYVQDSRLDKWKVQTADALDKLNRLDNVSLDEIANLIEFIRNHDSNSGFKWGSNILSGRKLRKAWQEGHLKTQFESFDSRPDSQIDSNAEAETDFEGFA